MRRNIIVIQIATMITLGLLLLCGVWIGVFFLTSLFYDKIGYFPPPFLIQVINSLLGLFVFILIVTGFSLLIRFRSGVSRRQEGVFEPIIKAMERIARGDFQVRLNLDAGANAFTSTLAKSVNQMAEDLNQMEHMRQEFISNVSHEIQSPLTAIRGFAQALHNEQLSAEKRQYYLGIIEMESMRLSRMTDNMLKLASLETEHVKIELKQYRLDKQIRTLILTCEPQWMSKTLEMDVDLEEVSIVADEDLLGQVWSNLLHNSIKFTPEGGKVSVAVRRRDNWIESKFTDTGIGIPEEAQARIFERFYKVDTSRERARDGNGLGLTIARKIVELHQGTIEVKSRPGAGTSVIVSVPIG